MTGPEAVRAHGCNLRAVILNAHTGFGDGVGLQILHRMAFEIADNGAEIHGEKAMAELLYKAADRLVEGAGPPVFPVQVPHVIDLVTPEDFEPAPVVVEKHVEEPNEVLTRSAPPATWGDRFGLFVWAAGVTFILRRMGFR